MLNKSLIAGIGAVLTAVVTASATAAPVQFFSYAGTTATQRNFADNLLIDTDEAVGSSGAAVTSSSTVSGVDFSANGVASANLTTGELKGYAHTYSAMQFRGSNSRASTLSGIADTFHLSNGSGPVNFSISLSGTVETWVNGALTSDGVRRTEASISLLALILPLGEIDRHYNNMLNGLNIGWPMFSDQRSGTVPNGWMLQNTVITEQPIDLYFDSVPMDFEAVIYMIVESDADTFRVTGRNTSDENLADFYHTAHVSVTAPGQEIFSASGLFPGAQGPAQVAEPQTGALILIAVAAGAGFRRRRPIQQTRPSRTLLV